VAWSGEVVAVCVGVQRKKLAVVAIVGCLAHGLLKMNLLSLSTIHPPPVKPTP